MPIAVQVKKKKNKSGCDDVSPKVRKSQENKRVFILGDGFEKRTNAYENYD